MFSREYLQHYKKTFFLAYPVCLSQLGHVMVGVVDTAMVGQIGTVEQAGVALAGNIFILALVFGMGISYGVTPMVAAADGEHNNNKNSVLLQNSFVVNLLMGILLFLLLYSCSSVLYNLNQPEEVVRQAIPFFNVIMFSMIPLSIFQTFKQFAEGLSLTKMAMIISVSGNVLNIILNYILIFGKFGFPVMGIMGSCWATFISRTAMAASIAIYVYYAKPFQVYWQSFSLKNISFKSMRNILGIGIPIGFQFVLEAGAFIMAAIMVGWLGARQIAAHQIAINMAVLTFVTAGGIGSAATVRVGNHLGLKDTNGLRKAGFSALFMGVVFMFFSAMAFVCYNEVLPTFFSKETAVIELASSLIVIAAIFQLSDGVQVVAIGALRGMSDVKIPALIAILAYWIIGLPFSYLLGFTFGLGSKGVWYGLVIGLSVAAFLMVWRFNFLSKRILLAKGA